MMTDAEFENVLSSVRNGSGLRDALVTVGKVLDADIQKWFYEDPKRQKAYLSAKKEFEDKRRWPQLPTY